MNKSEEKYLVGFGAIPLIGSRTLSKLLDYFKSFEDAWKASDAALKELGMADSVKRSIVENRSKVDLEKNYDSIISSDIKVIVCSDLDYPSLLKEIYDPPFMLYVKGELDWSSTLFFAVVGTRKLTPYGKRAIEELLPNLVLNNLAIVSGLAIGGDTVAHQVTLAHSGKTVAVLGSGVNCIYPSVNRKLAEEIVLNGGAVISEFPPDMEPRKQNFPLRNRIISGLSIGTLVIEASENSGTLITAQCALDQNREVFALPGSIFNPYSKGPASLIKLGAKLVLSVDDILEELNLENRFASKKAESIIPENEEEAKILYILKSREYVMIDELIRETSLPSNQVLSLLTVLEMKGKISNLGAGKYCIKI